MKSAPLPQNENKRLEALLNHEILDTPAEQGYDDLTKIASEICNTPIALVSIVDSERQWFKSRVGLDASETHRDFAFCSHAILKPEVLIIEDTLQDERFFDNPLVTGPPNIRFYAGTPLKTDDGLALGTLCVIDSKPRKLSLGQAEALTALGRQVETQLRLRLSNLHLKKMNDIRNKLLGMASHDLKNAFSTIGGLSKVLQAKVETLPVENTKDALAHIEKSAQRAHQFLIAMLEWTTAQIKGKMAPLEKLNAQGFSQEIIESMKDSAKEKDISLSFSCPANIDCMANRAMLTSTLQNLFSNAIKFSPSGSKVHLSVSLKADEVCFCVKDEGVGMTEEAARQLFAERELFTTKGTEGEIGSGIGTQLIRDFIASADGRIEIKSEVDVGTTIRIFLPHKIE